MQRSTSCASADTSFAATVSAAGSTTPKSRSMAWNRSAFFTVAEVARQSGFYSTKYFLQLFKKKTGITPSQYRKKPD